jgi:hypothetical protein
MYLYFQQNQCLNIKKKQAVHNIYRLAWDTRETAQHAYALIRRHWIRIALLNIIYKETKLMYTMGKGCRKQ